MNGRMLAVSVAFGVLVLGSARADAAEYSATYKVGSIAGVVFTDAVIEVPVNIMNTGTVTWNKGFPHSVELRYHWSKKGTTAWLPDVAPASSPSLGVVGPGETVWATARAKTPSTAGSYVLRWDLYGVDSVKWFSSIGVPTGDQPVDVEVMIIAVTPPVPKIEEIFPLSNITPGGIVAVRGSGFGDKFGEFYLKLASGIIYRIWNSPGLWKDHVVSGLMDPDVRGLKDEDATLYVKRPDGRLSNGLPVKFRARRGVKLLPGADVAATCSDAATRNDCFAPNDPATVGGLHSEDYPTGHTAPDWYSFSLKNGWVVDSIKFEPHPGHGWVKGPLGLVVGAENAKFHVDWNVDGCWPWDGVCYVGYDLYIYITGPLDVDHK